MDDKDNNELDGAKPREIPLELPLLVISDTVIFPNVIFPLSISDASTIKMINDALDGDRLVGVVTAKPREDGSTPTKDDVYSAGTVVGILKMFRVPDNSVKLLVQGINRFKIEQIIQDEPYKIARIEVIQPDRRRGRKIEALSRLLLDEYKAVIDYAPYLTDDIKMALLNIKDAEILADLIASNLNLEVVEKQKILEIEDLEARLKEISGSVSKELKLLKLRDKIKGDVDEKMEESQRQYYLREQLKAIKKELGEQDEHSQEMDELEKKVLETPMPEQAREAAKKELSRLSKMSPASAEYTVSRTYLDWIVDLPW